MEVVANQDLMLQPAQAHQQVPHLQLFHCIRLVCSCSFWLWRDWAFPETSVPRLQGLELFEGCWQPSPHATPCPSPSSGAPSPALPLHEVVLLLLLAVLERLGPNPTFFYELLTTGSTWLGLFFGGFVANQDLMLQPSQAHQQVPHLRLFHCIRLVCSCSFWLWRDWALPEISGVM